MAQYENNVKDFVEAGGRQISEEEMKSDLAAILPAELGDYMTVRVTDARQSYESFRDFAVHTCSQLLLRKRRLPVHHDETLPFHEDGGFN